MQTSSKARLVVLDEEDYKSLLSKASQKTPQTAAPEVEKGVEPETPVRPSTPTPTPVPPTTPPASPPSPEKVHIVDQNPSLPLETPSNDQSPLQNLLKSVPTSGHQSALTLVKKLSDIDEFDYNPTNGDIHLEGEPLPDYNLGKLLNATCRKSARNDIPPKLLQFLKAHGLSKFRNKAIKMPRPKWKSFFPSRSSTTR